MAETSKRLYLASPKILDDGFPDILSRVLKAGDVACFCLALSDMNSRNIRAAFDLLLPITEANDTAFLLAGDVDHDLVQACDGVHLETGLGEFEEVSSHHKPEKIVGVGNLSDRHVAMEVAEKGADYVMFGSLDPNISVSDHQTPENVIELSNWWAELFQVPCVAVANNEENAIALSSSSAEFLAIGNWIWESSGDPVEIIERLMTKI